MHIGHIGAQLRLSALLLLLLCRVRSEILDKTYDSSYRYTNGKEPNESLESSRTAFTFSHSDCYWLANG